MSLSIYLDINRAVTLAIDVLHAARDMLIDYSWHVETPPRYIYGQHFVYTDIGSEESLSVVFPIRKRFM